MTGGYASGLGVILLAGAVLLAGPARAQQTDAPRDEQRAEQQRDSDARVGTDGAGLRSTTASALRVTRLQPQSGAPGTPVRIRGAGFGPVPDSNTVAFGSATAPIDSVQQTALYARVPYGVNGPVSVSVTAGDTTVQAAERFAVTTGGTESFAVAGTALEGVEFSDADWGDMDGDASYRTVFGSKA